MATTPAFSKRSLGNTNLEVTPIGLGLMEFGGGAGLMAAAFPPIAQEEKNEAVRAGLEGGINWFDTAELYGDGLSETSLARALKAAGKHDGDVIVATKWWPLFRTAASIRGTIDERIRLLDGFRIGLYQIHQPFGFSSREAEMDAMADLVDAGKIQSVGVSNFGAAQMRRAHRQLQRRGLPLAANQVRFSLLDRRIETNGVLNTAVELGVTIIAYTPLESGLLTGKYHKRPEDLQRKRLYWRARLRAGVEKSRSLVNALEEIGIKYDATAAQVALNWTINFHGKTVVTIPGITSAAQARENAGAMKFTLSADDLTRLDRLSRRLR